jgi:hypothetical protein
MWGKKERKKRKKERRKERKKRKGNKERKKKEKSKSTSSSPFVSDEPVTSQSNIIANFIFRYEHCSKFSTENF